MVPTGRSDPVQGETDRQTGLNGTGPKWVGLPPIPSPKHDSFCFADERKKLHKDLINLCSYRTYEGLPTHQHRGGEIVALGGGGTTRLGQKGARA